MKLQSVAASLLPASFLLWESTAGAESEPPAVPPTTAVDADGRTVAVDEDGLPVPPPPPPPGAELGVGIRVRNTRLPQGMLEWFVTRAPGGSSELGLGIELIRRKHGREWQFGLGYDRINVPRGIWIESGKPIPDNEVDLVEFKQFGWISAEATYVGHYNLHPAVALRYGAGVGVAFLLGKVSHVDRQCTSNDPNSCTLDSNGGVEINYDLKSPVYPLLTGLVGVQFRPMPKLTVNLEGGIRLLLPFAGVSTAFFF